MFLSFFSTHIIQIHICCMRNSSFIFFWFFWWLSVLRFIQMFIITFFSPFFVYVLYNFLPAMFWKHKFKCLISFQCCFILLDWLIFGRQLLFPLNFLKFAWREQFSERFEEFISLLNSFLNLLLPVVSFSISSMLALVNQLHMNIFAFVLKLPKQQIFKNRFPDKIG